MIIILFLLTWLATFSSLIIFASRTWYFILLYILAGAVSGYLMIALIILLTAPFVFWGKKTSKFKHYYLRSLNEFVRLFVLNLHIDEIVNKENIPKDTNIAVYANHRSGADVLIALSALKKPMTFAAKNSLFKYKIGAKWLRGFGILSIDRENDRETLKEIIKGIRLMEDGLSMLVFPEGTRKKDEFHNLDSFKPGAFKLATKSKIPVIPLALIGAQDFRKQVIKKPTKVKVIVGEPIYYEEYKDMSTKELSNMVAKRIMVLLHENEQF